MKVLPPALAALLLAGCPLPQSVPESVSSVTPSLRIVFEQMSPADTIVDVSKSCPSQPTFGLGGVLSDVNQVEIVEARWFLDYDPTANSGLLRPQDELAGNTTDDRRPLQEFIYRPADWAGPSYGVHVVEVVVSNGFDKRNDQGSLPLPNRTALPSSYTQYYRWIFRYLDTGGACSG